MNTNSCVSCPPVTPRDYFSIIVLTNYEIYLKAHEQWCDEVFNDSNTYTYSDSAARNLVCSAMNAASSAYHLSDWVYYFYKDKSETSDMLFGTISLNNYRDYLNNTLCKYNENESICLNDFLILGDISNSYKHLSLSRKSRTISGNNNIAISGTCFGELPLGEGILGGFPELIVTLDAGDKRAFSMLIRNVINMWSKLNNEGLI